MKISLKFFNLSNVVYIHRNYDEANDSFFSILLDICTELENHCAFHISGFGQDIWPVQINTDLVDLLDQLPKLLDLIQNNQIAEIYFSEQNLERKIDFYPISSKVYNLKCLSWGVWQPNPSDTNINREELLSMLTAVKETFVNTAVELVPKLKENIWFNSWSKGNLT